MTTPIFKKVGRRYIEIGAFEDAHLLHYPHGAHLVWSRPGGVLTHYRIEPAHAALLAAAEAMREAMAEAMRQASESRQVGAAGQPLTASQKKAFQAYKAALGDDDATLMLQRASAHDIIEAGIKVLVEAAAKGCKP